MNWSSQSSPGFVYFNNSAPANQDFIPFSADSPPSYQQNKFGPQNYSTPQHHRRSFNKQSRNWNQNRFPGRNNRSYGNCSSGNESSKINFDNSYLIKTKFMHESFLENPWAELEKKLEEERNSKKIEEGEGASEQNTSGQKRTIDMID